MTEYRIVPTSEGVGIEVSRVNDNQRALLAAFEDCRTGRCSCPTGEYDKLAAMDVDAAGDSITIRLRAKDGEQLDTGQITACLDHTITRADTGDR